MTLLFSNTLTTLRRLPGRDRVEGGLRNTENSMSLEDCEWTLEWTGGQARALKVAAFPLPPPPPPPPRQGCNPSFF